MRTILQSLFREIKRMERYTKDASGTVTVTWDGEASGGRSYSGVIVLLTHNTTSSMIYAQHIPFSTLSVLILFNLNSVSHDPSIIIMSWIKKSFQLIIKYVIIEGIASKYDTMLVPVHKKISIFFFATKKKWHPLCTFMRVSQWLLKYKYRSVGPVRLIWRLIATHGPVTPAAFL